MRSDKRCCGRLRFENAHLIPYGRSLFALVIAMVMFTKSVLREGAFPQARMILTSMRSCCTLFALATREASCAVPAFTHR